MLISIDVCGDFLYIVEGSVTNGSVDIRKCDEAKLPNGTVEDGIIKNHSAFVMTLSKLLNAKSYKAQTAVMTFSSNTIMSRRLELPPSKPNEITAMVKNQMAQLVSDPSEYIFEYTFTKESLTQPQPQSANGEQAQPSQQGIGIWAYAVQKEIIDKYYAIFKDVKIRPFALDIHSNSLEKLFYNAAINGNIVRDKSILVVDLENSYVEIHLYSCGEHAFSRITPISAVEFLAAANSLGYGKVKKNMSLLEKRLMSMSPENPQKKGVVEEMSYEAIDVTPGSLNSDPVFADSAHRYLAEVSDELAKMVQFQLRRDSSRPVTSIYLNGTLSGMQGLGESLSLSAGCLVERIASVSHVRNDSKMPLYKYANAIGALIRV